MFVDNLWLTAFTPGYHLGMRQVIGRRLVLQNCFFENTNSYAYIYAKQFLTENEELLDTVISPSDKKIYLYTEKNIIERFFRTNRIEILKEVNDATTQYET